MLDPTTICGGDKFGNIFVLRLPDIAAQVFFRYFLPY
jgi:hypothetical protein